MWKVERSRAESVRKSESKGLTPFQAALSAMMMPPPPPLLLQDLGRDVAEGGISGLVTPVQIPDSLARLLPQVWKDDRRGRHCSPHLSHFRTPSHS